MATKADIEPASNSQARVWIRKNAASGFSRDNQSLSTKLTLAIKQIVNKAMRVPNLQVERRIKGKSM